MQICGTGGGETSVHGRSAHGDNAGYIKWAEADRGTPTTHTTMDLLNNLTGGGGQQGQQQGGTYPKEKYANR